MGALIGYTLNLLRPTYYIVRLLRTVASGRINSADNILCYRRLRTSVAILAVALLCHTQ